MLYFFGGPRLLEKIGLGFLVQPVGGGSKGTLAPSVVLGGGAVVEPATGNDINEGIAAFQQQLAILTPRALGGGLIDGLDAAGAEGGVIVV